MNPKLHSIFTSTRAQRAGGPVATWFVEQAKQHGKFEIQLVDLKEVNLPLLDEPHHPMQRRYQNEHTRAWSKTIDAADAFVFIVPEYNFGMPPSLLNALDYLFFEWNYKPAGFVSYGGLSGGIRSVQMTKQMLNTLKVVPLNESVSFPFFSKQIDAEGKLIPGDAPQKALITMLDELLRWTTALRTLRS